MGDETRGNRGSNGRRAAENGARQAESPIAAADSPAAGDSTTAPQLSVVVATYNRANLLLELAHDLAKQTLSPASFEVVVVDDGSQTSARSILDGHKTPFALRVIEQANAGPAAARDRGIAAARGEIILIVDDDMRLPSVLLEEHLARHREGYSVVLGHIRSAPHL
jgi:glycosyltransferase involved in cell wall biosynthesis